MNTTQFENSFTTKFKTNKKFMNQAHESNISRLGFPKRSVHHTIDKLISIDKSTSNVCSFQNLFSHSCICFLGFKVINFA